MTRFLTGLIAMLMMAAAPGVATGDTVPPEIAALAPNAFVWDDRGSTQTISIVISIADQKAYVYRGDMMVGASTVSTGRDGKDTPVGTFPILQKEATHHSTLYANAPMPFMQRLTWDGVALHAGRNPGFPDSHGCIRLPTAFAKRLFAATNIGTKVMITDASAAEGWSPPEPDDVVATPR
jgi:lipoprotein-anchoring transpeptidase ErfK/SrfK